MKRSKLLADWPPLVIGALILFGLVTSISGSTIHVPSDQATIQAAIDAAVSGDTVLVAPGTYLENINLRGKGLVLTSNFALDHDPQYIFSTIIDGGSQSYPDSGSTVLVAGCDDPLMTIQGFTITGGSGTRYEWSSGNFDKMGGGIFVLYSYATIQYNYITENIVETEPGLHAAGGGGMQLERSVVYVRNNIIARNHGNYGAGIGHGHGTSQIRNNVIAYNYGGEVYGGSGIQMYDGDVTIENNTIVSNVSAQNGGGLRAAGGTQTITNNIIWHNEAPFYPQLCDIGTINYCNVQGGWPGGTGNIDSEPHLTSDEWLYHFGDSPDVDAGDPDVSYHDVEHATVSGTAAWPSFGALRNDMGAYGGPGAFPFQSAGIFVDETMGWDSLAVEFSAFSPHACDQWIWEFGDGGSANGQSVTHKFQDPGIYDVDLTMVAGTDIYAVAHDSMIVVLADTVYADVVKGAVLDTIEVAILARNTLPLEQLIIPIEYSGDCPLDVHGWSTDGCRTDGFGVSDLEQDPGNSRLVLAVTGDESTMLEAGYGEVLRIEFIVSESCSGGDQVPIVLDGYTTWLPLFEAPRADYSARTVDGMVITGCCGMYDPGGRTGNVNQDPGNVKDLTDILLLAGYAFLGGDPPICMAEMNVSGDAGCVYDLSDVLDLASYSYLGGDPPAYCISECE